VAGIFFCAGKDAVIFTQSPTGISHGIAIDTRIFRGAIICCGFGRAIAARMAARA